MKIYYRIEFLAIAVAVCVGLAMEHPSLSDPQLAHAVKVTATSYNDGFVVGKMIVGVEIHIPLLVIQLFG